MSSACPPSKKAPGLRISPLFSRNHQGLQGNFFLLLLLLLFVLHILKMNLYPSVHSKLSLLGLRITFVLRMDTSSSPDSPLTPTPGHPPAFVAPLLFIASMAGHPNVHPKARTGVLRPLLLHSVFFQWVPGFCIPLWLHNYCS